MKDNKRNLLENRLRKRLKILKIQSFEQYWVYLNNPSDRRLEIGHFLDAVTTNESYFQRSTNHFDILNNHTLPELMSIGKRKIRIWSAGCSTGEEPYDLAIILNEFNRKNNNYFNFEIFATDISQEVLTYAQKGEYADRKIAKIPNKVKLKYFDKVDKSNSELMFATEIARVKPIVQENIAFSKLNLVSNQYFNEIDVLFCRNVMIYFDVVTQTKIVNRFARSLSKNGYLFIGHSETLRIMDTMLESVRYEEGTIYKALGTGQS